MNTALAQFAADHRHLLERAARLGGFTAPVAVEPDAFFEPLLKAARKGDVFPINGVLVRNWDPDNRRDDPSIQLGMRLYTIDGIRFISVRFNFGRDSNIWGLDFLVVDRKDYRRLYRVALRCRRDSQPPSSPPVLSPEPLEQLWKNTVGYLDSDNLRRIKAFGGRARRGVLLTGSPGNGKTMACRWLWEECRRRHYSWRLVTPDAYRQARSDNCDPEKAVSELFTVERRGIVFFDDMDLALRDRDTVQETEDQAIFLTCLDGIAVNEGVVFVFTTNCALGLIDRAFKRPGRIDLVMHFQEPDATLRRRLVERWHEEIRAHLDLAAVVDSTAGYSFAEIEELKNLLVMHFLDSGAWDWTRALKQFAANRQELAARPRHVGFAPSTAEARNGAANALSLQRERHASHSVS